MSAAPGMISSEITFSKQLNGYDKGQVDRYIGMLTQAYQTAYDKYTAISGKYGNLIEEYAVLEEQAEQNQKNADAIKNTLFELIFVLSSADKLT